VKGKYSPGVERVVSLLEKAVAPEKKRKFVSFVDPDARFGRKRQAIKFAGYKAHIVEDESQIVTSAETIPGNENEGSEAHLESLLQKEEEKGLTADAVVCDALYDSLSNRVNLKKRGMKPYIPEKRENKRVSNFIYREKEDTLICQEGYASMGKIRQENGHLYYFSSHTCSVCPRSEACTHSKNRQRVYVSDSHLLYLEADPEKRKTALQKRKRIEAKFGEAKKHHLLTRARYRGRWRVAIQVFMTFLVTNLKRMIELLRPKANRMKLTFLPG